MATRGRAEGGAFLKDGCPPLAGNHGSKSPPIRSTNRAPAAAGPAVRRLGEGDDARRDQWPVAGSALPVNVVRKAW
jgi:hypothetical protein